MIALLNQEISSRMHNAQKSRQRQQWGHRLELALALESGREPDPQSGQALVRELVSSQEFVPELALGNCHR